MKKTDDTKMIINEIDKARLKLSIEHYIKYFIGKRTCEINKGEAFLACSCFHFALGTKAIAESAGGRS